MKTKILLLLFILLFQFTNADILSVPDEYTTIQSAINSCSPSDTILVDMGVYVEKINIDKPLTLTSEYIFSGDTLDIEQTIIDGNLTGSTISISGINNSVFVKGFTITGGNGTMADPYDIGEDYLFGGGFFIENTDMVELSNLVISENVITSEHNSAGGVYAFNTDISIINCNINNNVVNGGSFHGEGAGVFLFNTTANIDQCKILNNSSSVNYGRGGGVFANNSNLTVYNSQINNNSSIESGGIYCLETELELDNVVLKENFAQLTSSLYVYNTDTTACIIHNSQFLNNETFNSGGTIALVRVYADIDNIIIDGNDGGLNNGGINCSYSEITLKHSEITKNTTDSGIGGDASGILLYRCDINLLDVVIDSNVCLTPTHFNSGGAITASASTLNLDSVYMTRNIADLGGAIYSNQCSVSMKNSLIANNIAYDDGGAIYAFDSDYTIINTTIADNAADVASIFSLQNNLLFLNSILWNPDETEIYYYADNVDESYSDFAFTNVRGMAENIALNNNGDLNWIEGNLNQNPLFNDIENLDYSLMETSLAIDAGTAFFELNGEIIIDYNSNEYYGMRPDMGAYEYDPLTRVSNELTDNSNLRVFPNPCADNLNIIVAEREKKWIRIYDLKGQLVYTQSLANNKFANTINVSFLPVGTYLLQAYYANKISKKLFIKR